MMACHSLAFPEYALESLISYMPIVIVSVGQRRRAQPSNTRSWSVFMHYDNTVRSQKEEKELYPQKGEVPVVLDAGYLQVAHDYLTVLIVFAQGSVLLLQVRERAQFILCACTHCQDKKKHGKLCKLCMTGIMIIFPSTLLYNNLLQFPELKHFESF